MHLLFSLASSSFLWSCPLLSGIQVLFQTGSLFALGLMSLQGYVTNQYNVIWPKTMYPRHSHQGNQSSSITYGSNFRIKLFLSYSYSLPLLIIFSDITTAASQSSSLTILLEIIWTSSFLSTFQLVKWGAFTLARIICFTPVNFIQKHTDPPRAISVPIARHF